MRYPHLTAEKIRRMAAAMDKAEAEGLKDMSVPTNQGFIGAMPVKWNHHTVWFRLHTNGKMIKRHKVKHLGWV